MSHFAQLRQLLDLEAEAEVQELRRRTARLSAAEAEKTGNALVGLTIRDHDFGLGGRALVTLGKRNLEQPLPWNRLGPGTPVVLRVEDDRSPEDFRGVISRRDRQTIQVALAEHPDTESAKPTFRLDLSADEISRDRQRTALARANSLKNGRQAQLRDVLLGDRPPATSAVKSIAAKNPRLNDSQRSAIEFALAARDVAVIHGPPGTGKTTAVVEFIRQATAREEQVLACAPSNLGVDNLLERLVAAGVRAVRLGHPARVLADLREHTLDEQIAAHPDRKLIRDLEKEADKLRDKASRFTRAKPAPGAKQEWRAEAKAILADARRIERQIVTSLLDNAQVLCATLTGLDDQLLGERVFPWVVIDEAGQATEPAAWIAVLRADRLLLAGDHCQLPPTVVSPEAEKGGLGRSLLERCVAKYGAEITRRLDVQYRMHAAIMGFSSQEFYESSQLADASVAEHLLRDLPEVEASELTEFPLLFIDTAGAGYDEIHDEQTGSRTNPREAELVGKYVERLTAAGVPARDIAVITPYAAQARLLTQQLSLPDLEIDTVDGFQGREKEAVILSLVRSNERGEIGFLDDTRRTNVALTRARRSLVIIGDSATIGGHPFYGRLLTYLEQNGVYRSAWEEAT